MRPVPSKEPVSRKSTFIGHVKVTLGTASECCFELHYGPIFGNDFLPSLLHDPVIATTTTTTTIFIVLLIQKRKLRNLKEIN